MELLRHGPMTIDDLANELGLTRTAIRSQVTVLIGQGFVEPKGFRRGISKPARVFGVTAEAEQQLSRAYVPVLTHLLMRLSRTLDPAAFERLLGDVGRSLGTHVPVDGDVRARAEKASAMLRELGGLTTVTEEGDRLVILGQGCPLAAATAEFPQACAIIANLLAQMTGLPISTRCEEFGRTRCCFELSRGAA